MFTHIFSTCSLFLSLKVYSVRFRGSKVNIWYLVICLRGMHKRKIRKFIQKSVIIVIKFINGKKYLMTCLGIILYYNIVVYYR